MMAMLAPALQASASGVVGRVGDAGFERLRVSCCVGRDHGVGLRHSVVSSTSTRAQGRSGARSGGGDGGKPVSILPGDMKLLRDLQEFISSADLSPHQVPSTRELARRGRQDLVNAVRRRGEKALSQLLSNPNFASDSRKLSENKSVLPSASNSQVNNRVISPEVVQPRGFKAGPVPQNRTGIAVPHDEAAAERRPPDDSSTADDFLKDSSASNHGNKQGSPAARLSEVRGGGDSDDEAGTELHTHDDGEEKWARLKRFENLQVTQESDAWAKAAALRSKLSASCDNRVESVTQPRRNLEAVFDIISKQRESARFSQVGDQLSQVGADPAAEIARLTAVLHAKEIENLRVSRELEETKAILALLRVKHSAELAQTKQLAVEQELRLHAVEEALHSLKLVQVDWWGEGNRVEMAGSFNGWQHHAYLLPDLSSRALPGTRGPLLWRTELWLYPGVYEIKFVVDGRWVLDNRRDVVHGHMGENNLLVVEA